MEYQVVEESALVGGQKYRDQILRSLVVPHFDGHPFKVVALLPPVADSLALYGLCGLALPSIRIGRLANG
jgi:hypothetical protein